MRSHDLRPAVAATFLLLVLAGLGAPALARAQAPARPNLAHLDFLGDRVAPPAQAGHTTWRLEQEPSVGVLWTYAERNADGSYRRIGGGYDPDTGTYSQGAFNADDVARAAVVYLRYWHRHRDDHSRRAAYQLLRGLTYLQTVTGPNAGNVVLWMQPDGALNPSAEPREEPDPSDSAESYWLARTVWALGEGYREFKDVDRPFARFLRDRLDLAIAALDRQVLDRYGNYLVVDGQAVPAWLVVDGADATAEAMLGLAAYVDAGGGTPARRALGRFADGVARMGAGSSLDWPYGAVLPWALSRSLWHGWGAQMPAALAEASVRLGRGDLLAPAIADAASFTPHLLVAGGPDNGWVPAPTDRSQIAYGADSRVQSLLAVADASKRTGLRRLAGIAATWYFGNNAAGTAMYDPATGRTFDGVSGRRRGQSQLRRRVHDPRPVVDDRARRGAGRRPLVAGGGSRGALDLARRRGGGRRPLGRCRGRHAARCMDRRERMEWRLLRQPALGSERRLRSAGAVRQPGRADRPSQ